MKTAILAVSFGTSHNQTRRVTIEALEQTLSRLIPAGKCAGPLPARGLSKSWPSGTD